MKQPRRKMNAAAIRDAERLFLRTNQFKINEPINIPNGKYRTT